MKHTRKRIQKTFTEPSLTDQSFKKDCDVNEIIRKYKKTGEFTHLTKHQGRYLDVSEITDLQDAMDTVAIAQNAFLELPAELRERFRNDPVEMYNFLQNPANDQEAVNLGLKKRIPLKEEISEPPKTTNKNDEQQAPTPSEKKES